MTRRLLLAVAACGLAATAGCAHPDERGDAAAAVARQLAEAATAGDGATACALLAPDTRAELESSAGTPCAAAIGAEDLPAPAAVTAVDVYGESARVVTATDTVFLGTFPGGWRVVAAGCTGRGDGRPYDCALQGG
ncbi:hypothetical protein [Spirilliplanes yamanashiensis]|uniref:Lipoprotein n=1 Tax=Spirilliplanes yamanashiensis TaxID=42233 RepID=A0A8J4DLC8_9ACTN|nr:hypothetical protein [Spirilliplanes yamanashiensis]MDP9818124.1 hypothetical protein [Spirilliplanes yamanashiensis]GIJ04935.1 hypothetical protein Sya03_42870 [Spirilliplanes yamanashiensis]